MFVRLKDGTLINTRNIVLIVPPGTNLGLNGQPITDRTIVADVNLSDARGTYVPVDADELADVIYCIEKTVGLK